MNQITIISPAEVAAVQPVPSFIEAGGILGATIRCAQTGTSLYRVIPGTERAEISADTQQAAWQHLQALRALLELGTQTEMLAWLAKLRHSVANAPTDWAAIRAKGDAIWEQCSELPRAVWCDDTRKLWCQQPVRGDYRPGDFWPLPGALFEILSGYASRVRRDQRGCEAILTEAGRQPAPTDDERHDPAQQQAVTDLMKAWRGEQKARQTAEAIEAEKTRHIAKATPVNDELLLAIHEDAARNGNALSGIRAKFLRQKMGLPENAHAPQ